MKSKRTKATDITYSVRKRVKERDKNRCIYCFSSFSIQIAHFIPRSLGGLGIAQNLACICLNCHLSLDQSTQRKDMLIHFEKHLKKHYPNWNREELIYKK